MSYKIIKKLDNGVRIGELTTPHGKVETPFFMPVGTVGSVKGVSPLELNEIGAQIVLSNTYHLYLRPGEQLVKQLGGLHDFMRWNGPILTDSGGYQVFSLSQGKKVESRKLKVESNSRTIKNLVKITEEGVEFTSHLDGSKHMFTPEKVIQIQLDLGVDILMPLDVCPSGKASKKEVQEACEITTRWARRAKTYFDNETNKIEIQKAKSETNSNERNDPINENCKMSNDQFNRPLLHGIIQGGLYEDLRRNHAKEMIELDFDGYSIGGLAVDNETRDMWGVVELMGELLPENKQRYLMGVGTPDDIIRATKLGVDMFDCVLPTRLARHGSVYRRTITNNQVTNPNHYELINLLNSKYRVDGRVIDSECGCPACSGGFSRAYISHLVRSQEILGIRLTTLHNLYTYLQLMDDLRQGRI